MAPGSQSAGSTGVVHGLSGSVACVVFPDQGSNPCVQHWQTNSLPLSHQGSLCPSLPDLTSLSMIISSSIYVAANGIISFIFMTEWYPHMCVCVCLCVWISVQSLSHVHLLATPWTAAHQDSLSITNSWSYSNSCPLSHQGLFV